MGLITDLQQYLLSVRRSMDSSELISHLSKYTGADLEYDRSAFCALPEANLKTSIESLQADLYSVFVLGKHYI